MPHASIRDGTVRYLTDAVAAWIDEDRHLRARCRYRLEASDGRTTGDLELWEVLRLLPRLEGNWRVVASEASCPTSNGDGHVGPAP